MSRHIRKFGLIGFPLGHSFSKSFFSEKFKEEHINAEYLNFEIANIESLPDVIAAHPGLEGFNVTIPYKSTVMKYLDVVDETARKIGAVNTVKISTDASGNRTLTGYNTDIIGFTDSLRPYLRSFHKKSLVLGSGGASKAIVKGLESLGIMPTIVSRSMSNGDLTYADLTREIIDENLVIVNATPLGMYPDIKSCPDIPYQFITSRHVCFDAVYNPDPTEFMIRCARNGAKTVSGIDMLHLQAITAWKIWNSDES